MFASTQLTHWLLMDAVMEMLGLWIWRPKRKIL